MGPKQAGTIRRLYELFIRMGGNSQAVSDELNREELNKKDHRGRLVEDFTASKVELILQRCIYAGGKGEDLRIVSDKTFRQARRLLGKRADTPGLGCDK